MTTKTEQTHQWVVVGDSGQVTSRRFHRFTDCSMMSEGSPTDLNVREVKFLGLKECAVCTKRAEGGPALDLLEGFFGEDYPFIDTSHELPREMARALIDYLKDHGAFVAIRKPKDNGSAT